ncbi:ABC transporter permease [Paenibacillus sp. IITD108]|uniref:ABC transporter permease n=1 Tax=Paenibacillus sp. IITD108 TaxID=3116649 RepID=UPI002F3FB2E2
MSTVNLQKADAVPRSFQWQRYKYYYALLLPGLLYFLLFHYVPMFGVMIAFKEYKLSLGIWASDWAGLKWFQQLYTSDDFWIALRNTVIISFYKLAFVFPVPIIIALMLNELWSNKFKRVIQTIIYFPHFVSWVILGGILYTLFSPSTGLLTVIGISKSPLMDPETFRGMLITTEIWKEAGWGTVIYLAAIAGINPELYEAAKMDGASKLQEILRITLPSIGGTIVILLILKMGHILNAGFDQVFILYNALVYNVADILDTYVYRVGLAMGRFPLAAAAGLFKSVVGLFMIIVTNAIARRVGGSSLW